jgi:16S rRNA (adenine1518-N6/adenine1519-N6)-dimethyltransferase
VTRSQQDVLRQYGIRPVKRRGQNFLLDGNLARAIADEALALGRHVLELGAGGGALTLHLLAGAERVTAVEVDRNLCEVLRGEFGADPAFGLIEGDLGQLDWEAALAAAGPRPVLAGNLPYVLTSKILFTLADLRERTAGGVFMIQKEVAQRLVAAPGSRDYGILTVLLGTLFTIKVVRNVPPAVFWPRPEVDSAVVRLVPAEPMAEPEYAVFAAVVKKLFGQRRKKLGSRLRDQFGLDASQVAAVTQSAGLDPDSRPEQIQSAGLRRLAAALAQEGRT